MIGAEPVTRIRYGAYIRGLDGRSIAGAAEEAVIQASVQPVKGRDLEFLTEGLRQQVTLKAYTQSEIRTADQTTGTPADSLVIDGEAYEVLQVERQRAVVPHYKAYLTRASEPQNVPVE